MCRSVCAWFTIRICSEQHGIRNCPKKHIEERMSGTSGEKIHSKNITHCSLSSFVSPRLTSNNEMRVCMLKHRRSKNSMASIPWSSMQTGLFKLQIDFCNAIIKFQCRINDIAAWLLVFTKKTTCEWTLLEIRCKSACAVDWVIIPMTMNLRLIFFCTFNGVNDNLRHEKTIGNPIFNSRWFHRIWRLNMYYSVRNGQIKIAYWIKLVVNSWIA